MGISKNGIYTLTIFIGILPVMMIAFITRSSFWIFIALVLFVWGGFSILSGSLPQKPIIPAQNCLLCGSSDMKIDKSRYHCEKCKGTYLVDSEGWVTIIDKPRNNIIAATSGEFQPNAPVVPFRILDQGEPVRSSFKWVVILIVAIALPTLLWLGLAYLNASF